MCVANIFFQSVTCFCTLLMICFDEQKLFILMKPFYQYFLLVSFVILLGFLAYPNMIKILCILLKILLFASHT